MVQDTESIAEKDWKMYNHFKMITEWEHRLEYLTMSAINHGSAKMYGKKVQHCQNNAYILKQGSTYLFYSESKLVSGLMNVLAHVYNGCSEDIVKQYDLKFLELLVDIVPDQTINNLLKAFREA